jgi:aminoglycoside 3-N-acetyltransferase
MSSGKGALNFMAFLVHTDISKIDLAILRNKKYGANPQNRALNYLIKYFKHEEIWFPSYNYNFGETKIFNPKLDGTSVGAINLAALQMRNSIRTLTPIYSYVGFGKVLEPKLKPVYKPFNVDSELQDLLDLDSEVVFFGAQFNSFTFLHYIEEKNEINYRYVKKIAGHIQIDNKKYETLVEMKVRPLGKIFNYDWRKIENDLIENKIIRTLKKVGNNSSLLNMSESLGFITKQIEKDPYYLLDEQTKNWVVTLIKDKKRAFVIGDFEEINN